MVSQPLTIGTLTEIVQGVEDTEDIKAILYSFLGEVVDGIVTATEMNRRRKTFSKLTDSWYIQHHWHHARALGMEY